MQSEGRLTGRDTMRYLAFIISMRMYFSGKHLHPGELASPVHQLCH
jgi:hypothetical protein